jgi:universal stress protein A
MKTNASKSNATETRAADAPASAPAPAEGRTGVFHIKKILVPTDFSEASRKALAYATAFARQFGGQIWLLHTVEPLPYTADFGYGVVTLQQPNEVVATKAKAHLNSWGRIADDDGLFADPLLRHGSPYHEICLCAKEIDADIIIIATHGYTGLDRALLGSVTERVARHAPCPVLIVRTKEHDFVDPS